MRSSEVPFDLYAKDALYESEAAFLGILKDGESPLMRDGICFVAPDLPREGTILRIFHDTFWMKKNVGRKLSFEIKKEAKSRQTAEAGNDVSPIWLDGLTIGNVIRIHISPDKELALFLLHFRLPQQRSQASQSMSQVESTSYWLHKTDDQSPTIYVEGQAEVSFSTVLGIVSTLIHSPADVASLYHPGRLLTATYVQVSPPEGATGSTADDYMREIRGHVVSIGQSKDYKYELPEDSHEVHHLFRNILVHVSPEGFCGTFINAEEKDNTGFISKSSTTFLKSYLPVFIECVLTDLVSTNMLSQKGRRKKNLLTEQSEQFRELKLMNVMPVSRYSHLQQLKSIITGALAIQPKIETVSAYLETLREQAKQRQDNNLNFLIGFMGVGQVVFAILELSRMSQPTDLMGWQIVASVLSVIFGLLAVIITFSVVRSYFKK